MARLRREQLLDRRRVPRRRWHDLLSDRAVIVVVAPGTATAPTAVVHRRAVRAVAWRGADLLLLEADAGDYKFPGGGVEEGESEHDALAREVAEECGAALLAVEGPVLDAVERRPTLDRPDATLEMVSTYYACTIAPSDRAQSLEVYERELGLRPVWVDATEALAANRRAVASGSAPVWTRREILVLEHLLGGSCSPARASAAAATASTRRAVRPGRVPP